MNNFKYAKKRDQEILEALEKYHCLDTFQLALMFFPSQRMARKRMLELYKRKKVKRVRLEIDQPNVYYINDVDENKVKINWVRLYLEKKCAYGDTPINFDYNTLILTYENQLNRNKRYTRIEVGKKKIDFGGSVFYLDDKKVGEVREVLLCGR